MSLTDRAAANRPAGKRGNAAGRDDLRIFLVAGEHSGDALGGKLMSALSARCKGRIHYLGVGGEDMEAAGLAVFMVSACVFGTLLWHPASPVASTNQRARIARRPDLVSTSSASMRAPSRATPATLAWNSSSTALPSSHSSAAHL